MLGGLTNESHVSISIFPVAWRIEMVDERDYRGQDYVRWGSTHLKCFGLAYIDITPAFSGARPT